MRTRTVAVRPRLRPQCPIQKVGGKLGFTLLHLKQETSSLQINGLGGGGDHGIRPVPLCLADPGV